MAVYDYGTGCTYASPQAALDALQEAHEVGSNGSAVFTGTGLDDATEGGTPEDGAIEHDFVVEIDATGTPDTFKWSLDGGSTWEATGVAITGAAQDLDDGVTVTFGATTGHTLGDKWEWSTSYNVSDFSEANYITCGAGGTFAADEEDTPVLRLCHSVSGRGVQPTKTYPLTLDVDDDVDTRVRFEDVYSKGALVGSNDDGENSPDHVIVDGIELSSVVESTDTAVMVREEDASEMCYNWLFKNCQIDGAKYGIILGEVRTVCIQNCRINVHQASGAAIYNDTDYGPVKGLITLTNTIIWAAEDGIKLVGGAGASSQNEAELLLQHVSMYCGGHCIMIDQNYGDYGNIIRQNCILYTYGDSKYCLNLDYPSAFDIEDRLSNANCYHYPGTSSKIATYKTTAIDDLDDWKALMGGDGQSMEEDPAYYDTTAADLRLSDDSPCKLRGRAAPAHGLNPTAPTWPPTVNSSAERALNVDMGAYQHSAAGSWSVGVAGNELSARISGRIPVSGLT